MTLPPILITRDLTHFRKSPARRTALLQLATAFLSLLASPTDPAAPSLRAAFMPASTGIDSRPSDPQALDLDLQRLFARAAEEVEIVLLQTVPMPEHVEEAWRAQSGSEKMGRRLFVALTLEGELERARDEGDKEEEANLSMMILATLAYELAHYIFVKVHGHHTSDAMSDTSSLYTTNTRHSISSRASSTGTMQTGMVLAPLRNRDDAGTHAVTSLFGCDFELVTYSLGTREVIKRRVPTRRSATLTPPIVYRLIGDTPAIKDCTAMPLTTLGCTPPHRQGGEMYDVTSVLTPRGLAKMHGRCVVHAVGGTGGGSVSSVQATSASSASSAVSADDGALVA